MDDKLIFEDVCHRNGITPRLARSRCREQWLVSYRRSAIRELSARFGWKSGQLALWFKMTKRTVQRCLK